MWAERYHVAENRAFFPQAVECAVYKMSTNRSVGSQLDKEIPPHFLLLDPSFCCEGVCG